MESIYKATGNDMTCFLTIGTYFKYTNLNSATERVIVCPFLSKTWLFALKRE